MVHHRQELMSHASRWGQIRTRKVFARGSVREQAVAIADTFDFNQHKRQLESSDQVPFGVARS